MARRLNRRLFIGALLSSVAIPFIALALGHGTPVRNSAFRDPGIADDASRGNVVGRLWLNLTTGQFWTCSDATNGAAVWADAGTPKLLPGDAVAGVTACYGTKPLRISWGNGNLFRVQRKSDNATQIIKGIGGSTDIATLNTFLSGTVGQFITWYDQSGNGSDATQVTIGSAPYVRVVGQEVHPVFDKVSSQGTNNPFLNLPSVSWGSSFSLFQQSQLTNVIGGSDYTMFKLGTDSSNQQFYSTRNPSSNSWCDQSLVNLTATYLTTADCQPCPFSFISSSSAATAYWMERAVTNANWKTLGTPVGGTIGKDFDGTVQAFMVWGGLAMSAAQSLAVRKAMYQTFRTVPQCYNDLIVTDGDSEFSADNAFFPNLSGNSILGGAGYFHMVQCLTGNGGAGLFNRPCRWINTSITGQLLSQISGAYATRDVPLIDPNARNRIIIFNGGEHEADGSGQSPATVYAAAQTFCSTVTATSAPAWTAVFYCNVASYNHSVAAPFGGTMEAWRAIFNPLTRSGLSITGLMDVGDTSKPLGAVNGYADKNYFDTIGIHWGGTNAQGSTLAAQMIANLVNAQLGNV